MKFTGRVIDIRADVDNTALVVLSEDRVQLVRPVAGSLPPLGAFVSVEKGGEDGREAVVQLIDLPPASVPDPDGDVYRWRKLGDPVTRMEMLRRRQEIVRAIREDLYGEGFLEAQTPLLVRGSCPDLHIDSFAAHGRYLVTSTEYQLKRMIVGGFERIFTLTQNYRRGEVSAQHNPEFTMLEWARAFERLDAIEADAERFVRKAYARVNPGRSALVYGGREIDLFRPWERLSVRAALKKHLGVEVAPDFALASMQDGCERAGLIPPESAADDALSLVSYLLVGLQPHLGWDSPTFLREWPAFMTSSAELSPEAPWLAERSELFIAGIEIADGFPSLRDPGMQRETFARELARRSAAGKEGVELDEHYLSALDQGLPPGAGMALGIDRLVMVLVGASEIRQVLPFAWDEL